MGKVLFLDPGSLNSDAVKAAATVVREGGVVLSPTDTVYGLACDPGRKEAVRRIQTVKGRRAEKGFLLLIPGPEWVNSLAAVVPRDFQHLKQFWPGPVTFLFAAGPDAPPAVVAAEETIGLRCPLSTLLQSWLKCLGHPLLSTSANRSGMEGPGTIVALRKMFEDSVDLLLLSHEQIETKASTVVDLTADPPRMVRRGEWADRVEDRLSGSS